jgi:hypothetical protein
MKEIDKGLFEEQELAKVRGCSVVTLRRERREKRGPAYIRLGRKSTITFRT